MSIYSVKALSLILSERCVFESDLNLYLGCPAALDRYLAALPAMSRSPSRSIQFVSLPVLKRSAVRSFTSAGGMVVRSKLSTLAAAGVPAVICYWLSENGDQRSELRDGGAGFLFLFGFEFGLVFARSPRRVNFGKLHGGQCFKRRRVRFFPVSDRQPEDEKCVPGLGCPIPYRFFPSSAPEQPAMFRPAGPSLVEYR